MFVPREHQSQHQPEDPSHSHSRLDQTSPLQLAETQSSPAEAQALL